MIAIKALGNKALSDYFERLARRYPVIFIDECQDLSFAQLRIIKSLHLLGMRFHFVGDLNQSIYGFRRSEPALVKQFIEELAFKSCDLTANCRSGQGVMQQFVEAGSTVWQSSDRDHPAEIDPVLQMPLGDRNDSPRAERGPISTSLSLRASIARYNDSVWGMPSNRWRNWPWPAYSFRATT